MSDPVLTLWGGRAGRIIQRLTFGFFEPIDALIDWRQAAGIAIELVGEDPGMKIDDSIREELTGYLQEVVPVIARFSGLTPAGPLGPPVVLTRAEWSAVTSQSIKKLMEPVLEDIIRSVGGNTGGRPGRFARTGINAELGLVIGYLATRVLGQYDIDLSGPEEGGRLFFIYPNIRGAEENLGINPRSFRVWLALHEATHGFEFRANPWLRVYIKELIDEQTAFIKRRLGQAPVNRSSALGRLALTGSLRELISLEENPALAKIQALMSVLEGYSEYVMEAAGAELLEDQTRIAGLFQIARRRKNPIQLLIQKAIGLEMKLQQYETGYRFIKKAAEAGSMSLANRLWEGPRALPTLTELRRPELWVARMA